MGLMIYSLDNIPAGAKRDYFIYLLDYGWTEPISEILNKNFEEMSKIAAENKAVVIKGTVASHFQNEVLSWHHINGEDAENLLPALLITNKHPQYFKESNSSFQYENIKNMGINETEDMKMILIPFKECCNNEKDVMTIINSVFSDIENGKDLSNFSISKKNKKGVGRHIVDSVILQPNLNGIGIDIKKLLNMD